MLNREGSANHGPNVRDEELAAAADDLADRKSRECAQQTYFLLPSIPSIFRTSFLL